MSVKDKRIAGNCLGPFYIFFFLISDIRDLPAKKDKSLSLHYIVDVKEIIKFSFKIF